MPDDEFRLMVREWIAENYMLERNLRNRPKFAYAKPWYVKLSESGWPAPGWPVENGGSGLSIITEVLLVEGEERFGCGRLHNMGVVLMGPHRIRFGSEAQ